VYLTFSKYPGFISQSKMSLQLYQVDQRSFLLDFKSLNNVDISDSPSNSLSESQMGRSFSNSPPSSFSDLGMYIHHCMIVFTVCTSFVI